MNGVWPFTSKQCHRHHDYQHQQKLLLLLMLQNQQHQQKQHSFRNWLQKQFHNGQNICWLKLITPPIPTRWRDNKINGIHIQSLFWEVFRVIPNYILCCVIPYTSMSHTSRQKWDPLKKKQPRHLMRTQSPAVTLSNWCTSALWHNSPRAVSA